MRGRPLLGVGVALWLAGCAAFESPVARTVDGVTTEGRFIEPDAYALYALGALHEARGEWRGALALYERAREIDDDGPEIATRIAAVACQLGQTSVSDRAFQQAERDDVDYGPLWFELARCRRLRGDLRGALTAALEAVRLDPERHEASLLAADVADLAGDRAQAFRIRDALATRAPDSVLVQRSLLLSATQAGDRARIERAARALSRMTARAPHSRAPHGVERALAALESGDIESARDEAHLLLAADPSNGDALVIALAVADLSQDHAAFNRLLSDAAEPGRPARREVLAALSALLSRRVGAQAAALVQPPL